MSVNTKVNGQLVPSAGLYRVKTPIGMADIYSTEEKEVGLWKNNKPLYQKTLVIGNGNINVNQGSAPNFYAVVDSGISNIEEAFGLVDKSYIILSSDNSPRCFSWIDYQGNGSSEFVVYSKDQRTNVTVVLTIQYTKTTDTPWSGKFVPQGYGYVSSGDIYSFEERQVGVYADGKPLYQKTIDFGELPNNTTKQVSHNISNLETVVDVKGIINYTNLIYGENIPPVIANKNFRTAVRETVVEVTTTDNWSGYGAIITVQYTKTTDVAGSGEYVPSGDKAEHYSTEEEVIGTWINGEALYRQVIHFSTSLSVALDSAWHSTGVTLSNVDEITKLTCLGGSGGFVWNILGGFINSGVLTLTSIANCGSGAVAGIADIILEYTKTS